MSVQRLELGSALYGARGAAYRTEAVRLGAPDETKEPGSRRAPLLHRYA